MAIKLLRKEHWTESESENPERWVAIQCESACQISKCELWFSRPPVALETGDKAQSLCWGKCLIWDVSTKIWEHLPEGCFHSAVSNKKHSFPPDFLPAPYSSKENCLSNIDNQWPVSMQAYCPDLDLFRRAPQGRNIYSCEQWFQHSSSRQKQAQGLSGGIFLQPRLQRVQKNVTTRNLNSQSKTMKQTSKAKCHQ